MSLASAAGAFLKAQTPLQQLLEDINFQRTKEMRQLLKDGDSGFVMLQGTTYWTDLFVRHFLFQTEPQHSIDSDDLLFFVRKKHVKTSSRHTPKFETEVDVFRKDSRKLPIGDPDVDWEETVYLNMVIHQFDYTLTLAICTRTSPKELQVLRRHSQRVYASPSRRKMDTKGENEEITYPHICFMVDNFDEVFSDILVRDGEMVCVELVANDKDGAVQGVIFLGSIRYDALKKVYDARQSSLSSKVAQRMSFGLFSSGASVQTRCEFVRMKGPQGKGHAEMAVTKPKGSGVETPTSEPGFCATDMWDEWEEENDDYCTYRHQRRLSDPSSNLNNFQRYSWRTKNAQDASGGGGSAGAKARSENEGLDSLASEVSEIEAGDLRDDQLQQEQQQSQPENDQNEKESRRPAFSASNSKLHKNPECEKQQQSVLGNAVVNEAEIPIQDKLDTIPSTNENVKNNEETAEEALAVAESVGDVAIRRSSSSNTGCGNCFGGKKCKRWMMSSSSSAKRNDKDTPQMSEVYCPTCGDDDDDDEGDVKTSRTNRANETPACLNEMPAKTTKPKHKTIFSVESELVLKGKRIAGGDGANRVERFANTEKKVPSVVRSSSLSVVDRKIKRSESLTISSRLRVKTKDKENKDNNKNNNNKAKSNKDKDKNCGVSKSSSTTTNLLSKVSPKRMRTKASEKVKGCSNQGKSPKEMTNAKSTPSGNGIEKSKVIPAEVKKTHNGKAQEKEPVASAPKAEPEECEIADDASVFNGDVCEYRETPKKTVTLTESESKNMINVRGKEELPVVENGSGNSETASIAPSLCRFDKCMHLTLSDAENESLKFQEGADENARTPVADKSPDKKDIAEKEEQNAHETPGASDMVPSFSSFLPRNPKRSAAHQQACYNKALALVPKRRTPDGTNIYYWCDLPKKALKELDDGAYNPLWSSRGYAQSFHFWKENRRQQSTPLNAFLTYVTLPWWSIAKDLLDHREAPILTF